MALKFCPDCNHKRPLDDFYPRTRDEDGNPVGYQGYCKAHVVERNLAWRKKNPEWESERHKVRWQREKSNPERLAIRREYQRQYAERRRRKQGVKPRQFQGRPAAGMGERELLDAAPFVAWLRSLAERDGMGTTALGRALGISERAIRRYLNGEHLHADLAVVEAAIIKEGSSTLMEVYPSLYEERSHG